jgi:hypothetical protein
MDMDKTTSPVLLVMVSVFVGGTVEANMRCGNRLLRVGDPMIQARVVCGEPADMQRLSDVRILIDEQGQEQRSLTAVEEWIYLGEGGDLPRRVRFENGTIVAIGSAAFRGVSEQRETRDDQCRRQLFSLNDTTAGEVRLVCGDPVQNDRWQDEVVVRNITPGASTVGLSEVRRLVTRERWIYNFGPQQFLRVYEFANNRLVRMETGKTKGF